MAMQYCPYTNTSPPMCSYYKTIPRQLLQEIIKLCAGCGMAHNHIIAPPCMALDKPLVPCKKLLELLAKYGFKITEEDY